MPVEKVVDYATIVGFLYAFARISIVFAFLPLGAFRAAPETARVALAFAATIMFRPLWQSPHAGDMTPGRLAAGLAEEAVLGLGIGVSLAVVLEIFQLAAQIASLEAGLGYASTIDPTSGADSTVLLTAAQITSGALFFVSGADRLLIGGLATTLRVFPPESSEGHQEWAAAMIRFASAIFGSGLRLAAPVVVLLLLTDSALAVLGRLQPQLHLVSLTTPLKLAIAMLICALSIANYPIVLHSMMATWTHFVGFLLGRGN